MRKLLITALLILSYSSAAIAAEDKNSDEQKNVPNKIAFVDVKRILEDSKAGKSAKKSLENLKKKYEAELESEDKNLVKRREELEKQKEALSEKLFKQKVAEFKKRIEGKQEDALKKFRVLEAAYMQAIQQLKKETYDIIEDYSEDNKIDMVFASSELVYARKKMDITKDIIKLLDKEIEKVNINIKK